MAGRQWQHGDMLGRRGGCPCPLTLALVRACVCPLLPGQLDGKTVARPKGADNDARPPRTLAEMAAEAAMLRPHFRSQSLPLDS